MAGSVNKVILIGHLGADPEVKSFAGGGQVANFRLATSESWTDRATNERKERTEWHSVVVTNEALVRVAGTYLRKGSKVFVEGQLRPRKWQDRTGRIDTPPKWWWAAIAGSLCCWTAPRAGRAAPGRVPPPITKGRAAAPRPRPAGRAASATWMMTCPSEGWRRRPCDPS